MGIAIRPDLTVEVLADLFVYEPRSGLLTWRKSKIKNRKTSGSVVGAPAGAGYRTLEYNGRYYSIHHIIWAMHHGNWPKLIDHIDGNRLNNRLENLREATAAQNAQNSKMHRNNKSGRKGVSWHKAAQRWRASIRANGVNHVLGGFDTIDAAAAAYDAAALRLHGSFAKTNADISPDPKPYLSGETDVKMFDPCHWRAEQLGIQ